MNIMRRGQRGQGLIEFAAIFPIFAFLMFAVIIGGIMMGRYNNINNAAKEGARLGAVGATWQEVTDRAQQQTGGTLSDAVEGAAACNTSSGDYICVEWIRGPGTDPEDPGDVGSSIRVTIGYEVSFFSGFWGSFPIQMSVCAIQRMERGVTVPSGHEGTGNSC
jgi:hypothetical protein